MKLNISQFFALLIAIGVVMLFIFRSEKEYLPPKKVVNEYDKVLIKNKKSNKIKKSIIYLSASNISSTGTCSPFTN